MSDGAPTSFEVAPPVPSGPEIPGSQLPPIEGKLGPLTPEQTAAGRLEERVNRIDPEELMRGFLEGKYEEEEPSSPTDQGDEKDKRTNNESQQGKAVEPSQSDKDQKKSSETSQAEENSSTVTKIEGLVESFRKGEIDLKTLLDKYKELTGLPAINLEQDKRFQTIQEEQIKLYDMRHPNPPEQEDSYILGLVINQRNEFKQDYSSLVAQAKFSRENPEAYMDYLKYGIYLSSDGKPSIGKDPIWEDMERKARALGTRRAGDREISSFIDIEINKALKDFCRRYPEKAVIYAAFDEDVRVALEEVRKEEEASKEKDTKKPKVETSVGSSESEIGQTKKDGEDETSEDTQAETKGDQEVSDKDQKEAQEKTPEERIKELEKEVARLKEMMKGLEELNLLAEEYLKEQGKLPEDYEKEKEKNPFLALLILLGLGGLVIKEAAKQK